MLIELDEPRTNSFSAFEDERTVLKRERRKARISCDLLLARLYKNHPDWAMAALKGIQPKVVDLEPPPIPEPAPPEPLAEVIPIPTDAMTEMLGRRPTVPMIMDAVCRFYSVTALDVCSARRTAEVMLPRQVVMYLARAMTLNSQGTVGRMLGGRDHTTTLHAARKIERAIKDGGRLADEIAVLKLNINETLLRQPA